MKSFNMRHFFPMLRPGLAVVLVMPGLMIYSGNRVLAEGAAAEQAVKPPIVGVQLYSNQALVRRSTNVMIEPGVQSIRIDDLPGALNEDSVRVAFSGANIKIEEVRIDTDYQKLYRSQEARAAEERLVRSENRLRSLSNRYVMLREEEAAIRKIRVGTAPVDPKESRPLDPKRWEQTLDFIQNQLAKNQSETEVLLEKIDAAREDLAVSIAVAERYRSGIARSSRSVTVRFAFEAKQKERRELSLEYRIGGAAWFPVYQARVISRSSDEKGRVRLAVFALVRNETGEDWMNIRPVFSAADPSESARLPVLSRWAIRSILRNDKPVDSATRGDADRPAPSPQKRRKESPSAIEQNAQQNEQPLDEDLKPKDEAIRQQLNVQTNRSQDYFKKNNEVVQDKRARNRTERVETVLDQFKQNIVNRDSNLKSGRYERALEYSDNVIENIKSLSPEHRTLFAEEEQSSQRIRRQALEMLDAKRFTEHLVAPVLSSRGFDYRYGTERAESIRSDGTFRRIFLFEKELSASLVYESAPAVRPLAYLVGRVKHSDGVPLLAGPMSVFHNMDYTGEAILKTVSAGESFDLHLGANEEIGVERSERTFRKTDGIISRSYSNRTEVVITVRNQRRSAVELNLLDRIPVSSDERIRIESVSVDPAPLQKVERGIYRFRMRLKPGEQQKIRITYDLTHSADVLPVLQESGVEN